jgi:hypothetical protein
MAGFTGAPPIVTDGLVFAVDAANYESYTSGSNIVSDIITSTKGSLINGVSYDNIDGGRFAFDGTNDYIRFTNFNLFPTGSHTTEFILYNEDEISGVYPTVLKFRNQSAAEGFVWIYMRTSNDAVLGFSYSRDGGSSNIETNCLTTNEYNYITMCIDYENLTFKLYKNGNIVNNTSLISTIRTVLPNSTFYIGTYDTGANYMLLGKIPFLRFYNRALSSSEVLQNYNALKSRFNL